MQKTLLADQVYSPAMLFTAWMGIGEFLNQAGVKFISICFK
jgi:hypothetical protein